MSLCSYCLQKLVYCELGDVGLSNSCVRIILTFDDLHIFGIGNVDPCAIGQKPKTQFSLIEMQYFL